MILKSTRLWEPVLPYYVSQSPGRHVEGKLAYIKGTVLTTAGRTDVEKRKTIGRDQPEGGVKKGLKNVLYRKKGGSSWDAL